MWLVQQSNAVKISTAQEHLSEKIRLEAKSSKTTAGWILARKQGITGLTASDSSVDIAKSKIKKGIA